MADQLHKDWKAFLESVKVNWKIFIIAKKERNLSCMNIVKLMNCFRKLQTRI